MRTRVGAAVLVLTAACSGSSNVTVAQAPTPSTTPSPSMAASPSASPTPAQRIRPTSVPNENVTHPPTTPPPAKPALHYSFPIKGCKVSYGRSHHDYPATDMFAAKGCAIVAVVSGRIDEVSARDVWSSSTNKGADRGGISYSLVGDDGVRYYGSHLSALYVKAGQRVTSGQLLGRVGNTGDARGIATHQHFGISWPTRAGIWWVRRGELYPWPYLDSWKAGGQKSPVAAVAALHRQKGDVPRCSVDC